MKECVEFACQAFYELNKTPEPSGNEEKTALLILKYLEKLSPKALFTHVGGYGILALWNISETKRHPVLLRCDMDAVFLHEQNQYVHLCGHDGHMATMLGTAFYLLRHKFSYPFGVLFQPAEENGTGAKKILETDLFKSFSPCGIIGFHNIPEFSRRTVIFKEGVFSAAVKSFSLQVNAPPTHAAQANAYTLMDFLLGLHLFVSQRMEETETTFFKYTPIFLTTGSPHYGITPSQASYHATIRASSEEKLTQEYMHMIEFIKDTTAKHKWTFYLEDKEYFPSTINNSKLIKMLEKTALQNQYNIHYLQKPFYWGEDMGYYSTRYPTCFFGLGTGTNKLLHTKDYYFPPEVLEDAIGLLGTFMWTLEASI